MSWFDEQLRYREESENRELSDAMDSLAGAVMGKTLEDSLSDHEVAGSAIDEILKYYHCRTKRGELPSQVKTVSEQIEYRMRPFGIRSRSVKLDKGWHHHAVGAMLGTWKSDGSAVALIPGKIYGYRCRNIKTGEWKRINARTEGLINEEALCFYQPLPLKSLKIVDLMRFMLMQLSVSDVVLLVALMGISAALGLLSPMFTKWLFGDVLESGNILMLGALASFMICFSVTKMMFSAFQALINSRIGTKQNFAVEAAVMSRLISLPPSFFKQYSSGELAQRAHYIGTLCSTIFNSVGLTGLTSLFSLIYIGQIFSFAPPLVLPSILIMVVSLLVSLITTLLQIRVSKEKMEREAKNSGLVYAAITGISKIKLSGAEKRMLTLWATEYAKQAKLEYNPPVFLRVSASVSLAVSLAGTIIMYAVAIKNGVSIADYNAFTSAYGMVSSAFMSLTSIASVVANIRPILDMVRPLMEAAPEIQEEKEIITSLKGDIEVSHLSFCYEDSQTNVIDDLSLKIKAGEYLAIVGTTGCGKSTLLRLLLGFEKAQHGSIYYDRRDISRVDLPSLRQKIGVVMQNCRLFPGDIFSNIVITAPWLSMDDAWRAAELAQIAEDIRKMPMGMSTMISEGSGGFSGGQKQRLAIARSLASSPKILMFDEATSALDNVTQKKVTEAIDSLNCTRIVIAHRLSTIAHADRIIFLDKGKVIEDGTFDELIAKNGAFAALVERQRLDVDVD